MNPRIAKIKDEMEKLKVKISKGQIRLRELEKQLTDIENADIVAAVRGVEVAPDELAAFVRMFRDKQQGGAVPNLDFPAEQSIKGVPGINNDKEESVDEV
jgi:predicted  nucleic acid-binding Zn-ribbon protein